MKYAVAILFALATIFAALPAGADHVAEGRRGITDFYCEKEADALRAWTFQNRAEAQAWGPGSSCYVVDGIIPVVVVKFVGIVYDPMLKMNIEIYKVDSPNGIIYTGYPAPKPEGEPA